MNIKDNEIIDLYKNQVSITEISKLYKYSKHNISNILKINGVKLRHRNPILYKLPHEEICKKYLNGDSTKSMACFYACSSSTIRTVLKLKGIVLKPERGGAGKYNINKYYFDTIDSEEKAYFLGFLFSDGYNSENKNTVDITLAEVDKHILEKLSSFIYVDYKPLTFIDRSNSYCKGKKLNAQNQFRLLIANKYISRKLASMGMTRTKGQTLKFPEWLEPSLYRHFIRGYFDGDGSICIGRKNSYSFNIGGTYEFLNVVQKIMMHDISLNATKILKSKNARIHYLIYSGKLQIIRIKDWLYNGASIFLQRKFDKFEYVSQQA